MPGIMSNQPCFRQGTHPLPQLSHMLYLQSAINDLISLGPSQPLHVCLCNWTGESSPRVVCWKFPFVYWDKAPVFGRICPLTLMKMKAWIIHKYLDEVFGSFSLINLGNMWLFWFKLINLACFCTIYIPPPSALFNKAFLLALLLREWCKIKRKHNCSHLVVAHGPGINYLQAQCLFKVHVYSSVNHRQRVIIITNKTFIWASACLHVSQSNRVDGLLEAGWSKMQLVSGVNEAAACLWKAATWDGIRAAAWLSAAVLM